MLFGAIVTIFAAIIGIPVMMLFIEVVASLAVFPDRLVKARGSGASSRAAVVIPAHNESSGLLRTLHDLTPQLAACDRLIVVADNCSDDTAEIAAAAGADVLERNDLSRIGKGFALTYAIAHLRETPPDMVLFVDADCRIQADMLPRLKDACSYVSRPVQACFLMVAPKHSAVDHRLAEFFWLIRNWVRPLGLATLGLPVQIMGTGMMFPWPVVRDIQMDGNLVEDLKLGLDAAAAGHPPYFYPFVVGTSEFPETKVGSETQRQRWIQGHTQMVFREAPRYLWQALKNRNTDLLMLVLDMLVPPFSLLLPLLTLLLLVSAATFAVSGEARPLVIAMIDITATGSALGLAWLRYGQEIIPLRQLFQLLGSAPARFAYYGRLYFGRKAVSWVRTDRSKSDGSTQQRGEP